MAEEVKGSDGGRNRLPHLQDWQSYDAAASTHDRLSVPAVFARPAQELIDDVGVHAGAAVLDLGAGSGVAALAAAKAAGSRGFVVAFDPSLEMLRLARGHGLTNVVAGSAPGLPFANDAFDIAVSNFVLSHVYDCDAALGDIHRVLKSGGKFGATVWGDLKDEPRRRWQALAEAFVGEPVLTAAMREALPWEDWLADPVKLRLSLEQAGFTGVSVRHVSYDIDTTVQDFVEARQSSLVGRFVRHKLDARRWDEFVRALTDEFRSHFKDPLLHRRDAYIATAMKQPVISTSGAGR